LEEQRPVVEDLEQLFTTSAARFSVALQGSPSPCLLLSVGKAFPTLFRITKEYQELLEDIKKAKQNEENDRKILEAELLSVRKQELQVAHDSEILVREKDDLSRGWQEFEREKEEYALKKQRITQREQELAEDRTSMVEERKQNGDTASKVIHGIFVKIF